MVGRTEVSNSVLGVAAPNRLPVVDLVRTISITIVILSHSMVLAGPMTGPWSGLLALLVPNAMYGVTMFFVVSGFVITYTVAQNYPSLDKVSLGDFYHRRIARLLPLACVVLLCGAGIVLVGHPDSAWHFLFRNPYAKFSPWFVLSFPFLVFNWIQIAYSNSFAGWGLQWEIFWSLAIEEQFYLFYPFVLRRFGGSRRQFVWFMVAVIVAGFLYRTITAIFAPNAFWLGFSGSPAGFESIAFGVLAWVVVDSKVIQRLATGARFIIGMSSTVVALLVLLGPSPSEFPIARVIGPTIIALCVASFLVVSVTSPAGHRIPKVFRHPGRLSYGLYLLHPMIMFGLWEIFGSRHHTIFILAVLMSVIAVGFASSRWFETPLNRQLRVILPHATQSLKAEFKRRFLARVNAVSR